MTTQLDTRAQETSRRAGTAALVLGVLCALAVAFTYVLSLDDTFNPPNWVRVVGLIWIPIAFVGVPVAHFGLARHGHGRSRGRLGVLVTALSLAALVALVTARG